MALWGPVAQGPATSCTRALWHRMTVCGKALQMAAYRSHAWWPWGNRLSLQADQKPHQYSTAHKGDDSSLPKGITPHRRSSGRRGAYTHKGQRFKEKLHGFLESGIHPHQGDRPQVPTPHDNIKNAKQNKCQQRPPLGIHFLKYRKSRIKKTIFKEGRIRKTHHLQRNKGSQLISQKPHLLRYWD